MLGLHRALSSSSRWCSRTRLVYTAYSPSLVWTYPVLVGLTIMLPNDAKALRMVLGSFVIRVLGIVRPSLFARWSWYGLNSACQTAAGWLIHRVCRPMMLPRIVARVSCRQNVAMPSSMPSGVGAVRSRRYQILVGTGSRVPSHWSVVVAGSNVMALANG